MSVCGVYGGLECGLGQGFLGVSEGGCGCINLIEGLLNLRGEDKPRVQWFHDRGTIENEAMIEIDHGRNSRSWRCELVCG